MAALADAGEVSAEELVEAFLLETADPVRGPGVYRWMFRESLAERQGAADEAAALVRQYRATEDPAKREAIMARLAEIEARSGRGD